MWKRLYKKATFLVLLVLIPVLVLSYGMVSQEESGIVVIALASEGDTVDPLTRSVWDALLESKVMRCIQCESPEQARILVLQGDADVAWIFAADLETKIYDFAAHRSRKNAFVTILEPDNRVALKLVREVISGVLFPHCSEALYLTYIRENAPELASVSDERLLEYYRNMDFGDGLFVFTDLEGNPVEETAYLLTPVRGMLAVVIVLAGLAAAMYYHRDTENGTFSWVPLHRQVWVELGCQMISIGNVAAVALLSLILTEQSVSLHRELTTGLLYCLCVAAFSMVMRRVTLGIRGLGMITPLLAVMMLAVCPVFFEVSALRQVQYLFPPTYYIHGAYNVKYLGYMAAYTFGALMLCGIFDRFKHAS